MRIIISWLNHHLAAIAEARRQKARCASGNPKKNA